MISRSEAYQAPSLFSGLAEMLDPSHPLFRLANRVNWRIFDDEFEPLFCKDNGRPAKPIRLMVGLLILKHVRNLSDESIVEQWWKNRSRLGQCAGADWDTFDAAKLMIFSETVAF